MDKDVESMKRQRQREARWIASIAAGDEQALEDFYNEFFPRLYRYVYYRVGRDHHHAEEVIHDTFMEAINHTAKFDASRGSIESWLITLSRNRIRSVNAMMARPLEHEKSWAMLDAEFDRLFVDLETGKLNDAAREHQEELRDLVGAAMGTIPKDYAKLLEWKYVDDMAVREIAGASRKTEKAVESQLTRARMAFREAFRALASGAAPEYGL